MNTQPTTTDQTRPKLREWNDFYWRDRWMHIISEDEWAAELLADANFPGMERHPFALCGVSLPHFPEDPVYLPSDYDYDEDEGEICPECIEINGGLPEYLRT
ncbi:hypothetical protein PFZ49_12825 [Microbacterium lacticum]|uniref:hypothetical protein n=1 Tax=Microbacterium lacticum TaxID=33885 RepID=UPI003A8B09D7